MAVTADSARAVGAKFMAGAKASSRPVKTHIVDHGYTMVGLGLFDAAMFYHSLFTGLLVSGISFVVFEWKVSDE